MPVHAAGVLANASVAPGQSPQPPWARIVIRTPAVNPKPGFQLQGDLKR